MKKVKKIPVRKCIGCGVAKPKKELVRIVKNKENEIFLDETGKANGRGAYLCYDEECLKKAIKSKALNRAFESAIDEETIKSLEDSIKQ
ncbi:MAG: YlxR family protein [Gallicola sp.]|nr:YlxR family protein [Gallicola sp.]